MNICLIILCMFIFSSLIFCVFITLEPLLSIVAYFFEVIIVFTLLIKHCINIKKGDKNDDNSSA